MDHLGFVVLQMHDAPRSADTSVKLRNSLLSFAGQEYPGPRQLFCKGRRQSPQLWSELSATIDSCTKAADDIDEYADWQGDWSIGAVSTRKRLVWQISNTPKSAESWLSRAVYYDPVAAKYRECYSPGGLVGTRIRATRDSGESVILKNPPFLYCVTRPPIGAELQDLSVDDTVMTDYWLTDLLFRAFDLANRYLDLPGIIPPNKDLSTTAVRARPMMRVDGELLECNPEDATHLELRLTGSCVPHRTVPLGTGVGEWAWNGNCVFPTLVPPMRVVRKDMVCEAAILDGRVVYSKTCSHLLAGKTVPLGEFTDVSKAIQ